MTAPLDAEGDVTVRRFYWLRRLLVVALVGGAVLVASWVVWQRRAQRRLDAEVARWHEAGLRVEASQFALAPVPDDQNAAPLLAAAAGAYVDSTDLHELLYKTDLAHIAPDEARQMMAGALGQNAKAVRPFHVAATRPAARWAGPRQLQPADAWRWNARAEADLGAISSLVAFHANVSAALGDEVAFLQDMTDLRHVRRLIAGEPTLSMRRVAWALDASVGESVANRARFLKLSGPDAADLRRRAMTLLAEMAQETDPAAEAMTPFELAAASAAERARSPAGILAYDRSPSGRWEKTVALVLRPANERLASEVLSAWREQMIMLRTEGFPAIDRLRPVRPPYWRALGAEPAESVIQSAWVGDVEMVPWVAQSYSVATVERLATVGLACRLYALDHGGAQPSQLTQLVPDYLKAVPRDPYDPNGGTIRYAGPGPAAQPFVYSLGPRGKDLVAAGRAGPLRDGRIDTRAANPALPVAP